MSANYFDQLEAELRAAVPRATRHRTGLPRRERVVSRRSGLSRLRDIRPSDGRQVIELDLRDHPAPRGEVHHGRNAGSAVLAGGSVLITIAIVVVVAALVLGHRGENGGSTAAQTAGLRARLAVLRRPQRPSDVLPACCHPQSALDGEIIPRYSRLVATLPGARFYLVVTRPASPPKLLWSPTLGDQVAIVAIARGTVDETAGIPAADLSDPSEIGHLGFGRLGARGVRRWYAVEIVPDRVARVRWSFIDPKTGARRSVDHTAKNNVVIAPDNGLTEPPFLQRLTWYRPDGTVAPTSVAALRQAMAAQEAPKRAQILQYDLLHSHPAPAQLLDRFSIFKIDSRTGVKVAPGVTILHPRLSTLPWGILNVSYPGPNMDPSQLREVITPSGTLLVVPGHSGLCLVLIRPDPLTGLTNGGSSSCTGAGLAQAESQGISFTNGGAGQSTTAGVVPDSQHTVTIHPGGRAHGMVVGPGHTQTITPIYGTYIFRASRDNSNTHAADSPAAEGNDRGPVTILIGDRAGPSCLP